MAWLGLVWLGMAAVYPKAIKCDAFFTMFIFYCCFSLSSLVAKCIQCMYIRMVQENALRQYCNITFKYKGIEGGVVTEIVCSACLDLQTCVLVVYVQRGVMLMRGRCHATTASFYVSTTHFPILNAHNKQPSL